VLENAFLAEQQGRPRRCVGTLIDIHALRQTELEQRFPDQQLPEKLVSTHAMAS
jgi:hypothetical protein